MLNPGEQYVQNKVITFLAQKKPEWVLVFNFSRDLPVDVIPHFSADARFREIWTNYHFVVSSRMDKFKEGQTATFTVYRRSE